MVANTQRELTPQLMEGIKFREDTLDQQLDQLNPNLNFGIGEQSPIRVD